MFQLLQRKPAFVILYGLLPLWAAIAIVWIGSLESQSSEYWNVAPWAIVAAIPACAITLVVTAITLFVHTRSGKKSLAFGIFISINMLLVAAAGLWWQQVQKAERDRDAERVRALSLVRSHATVVARFGTDARVFGVVSGSGPDGTRSRRYEFGIDTQQGEGDARYIYAIVTAREIAGVRQLTLDCLTPTHHGDRDTFKDPCEQ